MSKLKPKNAESKESIQLTNVASMLKGGTQGVPVQSEEVIAPVVVPEASKVQDKSKDAHKEGRRAGDLVQNTKLSSIVEEIESKEYNCTGVIYIDEEIKEVLTLLKSKGKIKTSSLVSYILEEFIEENKDDINAIITSANRFL